MTQPSRADARGLPEPPQGWPVGSFQSYEAAQKAVDTLSDIEDFPVDDLTIVGVNLMQVEKVTARLTWWKVISGGALSGAWMGVFFGLLIGLFNDSFWVPLIWGVVFGLVFGIVSVSLPYAAMRGRRDFSSTTQIVAGRYDLLCLPRSAERARDVISRERLGGR